MQKLSFAERRRLGGFTLIELMIVVVIVGILVSVAYPSYRGQVQRTRRTEGKAALLETAQRLERCYTRLNAYNNGGCDVVFPQTTAGGHYRVAAGALAASTFSLTATPQGAQASDVKCAVLTLSSAGLQGALGGTTDPNKCW